jgi:hypothetical protein
MTGPRRPLGEMLTDVLGAVAPGLDRDAGLTVRSVALALPIEVALRRSGGTWQVLGDVPRTVTRTAFDTPPDRIEVHCVREGEA